MTLGHRSAQRAAIATVACLGVFATAYGSLCGVYSYDPCTTDPEGGTPCSAASLVYTVSCENGWTSTYPTGLQYEGSRVAKCTLWLGLDADDYYHGPCNIQPSGYVKVGCALGSGQCCYVDQNITPIVEEQGFSTALLNGPCQK